MRIETLFNKKNKLRLSVFCTALSIFFRFDISYRNVFLFGFPSGFLTMRMKTNSFSFISIDVVSLFFDIFFFYILFGIIVFLVDKFKDIVKKIKNFINEH